MFWGEIRETSWVNFKNWEKIMGKPWEIFGKCLKIGKISGTNLRSKQLTGKKNPKQLIKWL